MGKSYRIRTTPGIDKNIVVEIDQDFEQLEILSLKIRQDDVYLRMCADYGVIAGRVFANNGYGIPNAKVSVFIPVTPEDERNPIISSIYPFKNLEDTNEDGYKFNLLPYIPSYTGHVPTGTFPTRKDALTNQTVIELYDKYYKYTVTTNDSGDYMIFGVPVGTQTIVMNLDLSDMGPFSLAPSDLIRMGVATEDQFDGVNFRNSPNFNELPQIVVLNKTIEVSPFWGQPEICQIGITRSDFDITSGANIDIKPTAIFMGSLVSSNEKTAVDSEGVAKKETGNLCSLTTGPGEILAVTQTIYRDSNGLPILKKGEIPKGGKVIENDGTWMFDLPMNMDYIYTNEFGEQMLSNDPSVGIPTKGKYRFKVKWQQSKNTYEDYKRAYFLVPNIREKGWVGTADPLTGSLGATAYQQAQRSYAFSLDWSGYTTGPLNITNPDIQDAINCEDTFYEFDYNKVYTVSQLIDNNKMNTNKERFIGIKRIDDDTCADSINRYPVNEGVFHTSLMWRIFNILLVIFGVIGLILLVVYSLIAFVWKWLKIPLFLFFEFWIAQAIIGTSAQIVTVGVGLGAVTVIDWGAIFLVAFYIILAALLVVLFLKLKDYEFNPIKLPMLTYPDCDACDCSGNNTSNSSGPSSSSTPTPAANSVSNFIFPFNQPNSYLKVVSDFNAVFDPSIFEFSYDYKIIQNLLSGFPNTGHTYTYVPMPEATTSQIPDCLWSYDNYYLTTYDLPLGERINLFNTKGKYFNDEYGANRISVKWNPSGNPNPTDKHYDSVIAIVCQPGVSDTFKAGTLFSFVNPNSSKDPNFISGATNNIGTKSITGTTVYPGSISIAYADPTSKISPNIGKTYVLPTTIATDDLYYTYPSDIEYNQVITGMTLSDFRAMTNSGSTSAPYTFANIIDSNTTIHKINTALPTMCSYSNTIKPIDLIDQNASVIIIQRGVDPYSPQYPTTFGLGKIFGNTNEDSNPAFNITGDYRLNIPIKNTISGTGNELMFRHNIIGGPVLNNSSVDNGFNLYFNSYVFTPSSSVFTGFTTTLHNYYSKIDYSVASSNSYLVDSSVSSSNLTPYSYHAIYNNTLNVGSIPSNDFNSSSVSPSQYFESIGFNESVVGGSYMYRDISSNISNYYTAIYSTGNTFNISDSSKIIMRSDRLPSSDKYLPYLNNTLVLQQNNLIGAYVFSTDGVVSVGGNIGSPSYGGGTVTNNNNQLMTRVLETFDCETMVDLDCYQSNGLNFEITPNCSSDDTIEHGCYVFVREPLLGLFQDQGYGTDIENYGEWIYRFRFFYALCQGVLSNVFTNNWINGNLYAFPFKIDRYYNSLNQPTDTFFARDVVVLHEDSNTFYYRSSPYNSTGNFIGGLGSGSDGANNRTLKTPTTVLNLGPRDEFLKEITLNGNFDGYNIDNIFETSYNDLSETINLFAISRIIDSNFWSGLFGNQITRLFSRPGDRVDADFAQSAAVNSQIGVIPFDSNYYDTSAAPGGVPSAVVATVGGSNNTMIGIYFSSTTEHMQIRDYVSPGRTLRLNNTTNQYTYDYLPIKSQLVPHYKWKIENGATMWGKQENNWATTTNDIKKIKYQQMDRLSSGYPIGGSFSPNGLNSLNARGYLFQINSSGTYQLTPNTSPNPALTGAPWYFYFGLLKGSTAINKFYTKYIGDTGLNG